MLKWHYLDLVIYYTFQVTATTKDEFWHLCLLSVVKVPILQHLESLRDEELEERREKRRRQLAEEEESKQNERRASGAEQAREQSLQVGK